MEKMIKFRKVVACNYRVTGTFYVFSFTQGGVPEVWRFIPYLKLTLRLVRQRGVVNLADARVLVQVVVAVEVCIDVACRAAGTVGCVAVVAQTAGSQVAGWTPGHGQVEGQPKV